MKHIILLAAAVLSAGCMQMKALPHMNELLTLKAYSEEKDSQSKWIEAELAVFERVLAAVKDGSIKKYTDQTAIAAEFGPPVVSTQSEKDNQPVTRWLYRHPIQKSATDRVYLYFSPEGRLLGSEHVPPVQ